MIENRWYSLGSSGTDIEIVSCMEGLVPNTLNRLVCLPLAAKFACFCSSTTCIRSITNVQPASEEEVENESVMTQGKDDDDGLRVTVAVTADSSLVAAYITGTAAALI